MSWYAMAWAVRDRIGSEDGQDLLEYGLLMALIAVAAIAGVSQVGKTINSVFWEVIAFR